VLGEVDQVRRYGEANDFPVLPWKSFNYHPDLVAEARVVAASVLDAEGLWFDDLGIAGHSLNSRLCRVPGRGT
jgi:hypothetical protein